MANDLAALHAQLERLRGRLPPRGLLVSRDVDEIGALVVPLLAPLGTAHNVAERQLRDRAFTLLARGFEEVERHVRFALGDRVKLPQLSGRRR